MASYIGTWLNLSVAQGFIALVHKCAEQNSLFYSSLLKYVAIMNDVQVCRYNIHNSCHLLQHVATIQKYMNINSNL